jgi:hypothetical protein
MAPQCQYNDQLEWIALGTPWLTATPASTFPTPCLTALPQSTPDPCLPMAPQARQEFLRNLQEALPGLPPKPRRVGTDYVVDALKTAKVQQVLAGAHVYVGQVGGWLPRRAGGPGVGVWLPVYFGGLAN